MYEAEQTRPWWAIEDAADSASALASQVKRIENDQNGRTVDLLRDGSIYLNRDLLQMSRDSLGTVIPMPTQIINTTQAICDTVVSKHVEAETKVSFEVEDGDFEDHQKAEDMDRFCWGEFNRLNCYYKAELAFRDCLWAADGWVKWYEKNGRAACDRIFPLEILIDDAACMSGEPQEMYHRRYVARAWAMAQFPDHADKLRTLPVAYPPFAWPGTDTDVVCLIEGWHLASEEGEEDGRHVLCCGGVSIVSEPWCHSIFPFSRISWSPPICGAYSQSLVSQLMPLQLELGKMMKRIQHSLHLMSVPRIWQSAATKVSAEYNNKIGNVYKYNGPKPDIDASPAVNPELFAQADRIRERMYEQARNNPMQSGNMPSRFDSRPALREAQEIADQPHAWVGTNWQRMFVDFGKQLIRIARDVVAERGTYKTFGKARGFVEKIDWAECNLEDDRFCITPTPTSLLPKTVTGKRLVVQDLFQSGLITDPNDAIELLAGMPDVDAFKAEKTAPKRLVDKQIYMMIKKKMACVPDECQDPTYAKRRVQAQLQLLLTKDGVPKYVLDLLDNYIAECDNLFMQANPPSPPPPPPDPNALGGPAPGAMPAGAMPNGGPSPLPPGASPPPQLSPGGPVPGQ